MRRIFLIVSMFAGAGLLTAGSCGESGGEEAQGGGGGTGGLAAPTNLVGAPASSTSVSLNWTDNSSGETGFSIERSTDGILFAQAGTVAANTIAFTDTGLTPSTLYYYRVAAVSGAATSAYSNTAQVTTSAVTLAAPTGLTAVLAAGPVINLQWTYSAPDPTNFRVEYGNDGIAYTEIATVAGTLFSYSHATFDQAKTTHYYRVRAFSSPSDYSNYSNVASVVYQLPVAPTTLTAVAVSSLNIDLTWKDNSTGEIGFKIYRSFTGASVPASYTLRAIVGPNVQNYTDSGLFPSTTYYYYVRAYNSINDTPDATYLATSMSNTASATTYSGYWAEIAASATGSGISNDTPNSHTPSVAVDNWGRIVVVWANDVNGVDQVRLAFFDPSASGSASGWLGIETFDPSGAGTESTEQESDTLSNAGSGISMSGGDCADPFVVWDGTSAFHIVWAEKRSGQWEIVYRRVRAIAWDVNDNCYEATWEGINDAGTWTSATSDALSTTTHGFAISSATGHNQRPRAFYRGGFHYVAWQKFVGSSWDIYLTRLTIGGDLALIPAISVPEETSGATTDGCMSPTVVATSANLFTFWQRQVSGSWKIYGRQSATGGSVSGWATIVGSTSDSGNGIFANATGDAQHPAATAVTVSAVDNVYLAADANASGPHQIYLLKYNSTGGLSFKEVSDTILDSDDITGGGISATTGTSQYPSVAGDTLGNIYVAWQDSVDGDFDIFVRRYAVGVPGESEAWVAMGSSTGPPGVSANTGDSVLPQILVDSAEPVYLIWEDLSGGDADVLMRRW